MSALSVSARKNGGLRGRFFTWRRLYAGLDSLLLNGATRIDGLPPQTKVLRALVERGDEVDMVIHIDGEARPLVHWPATWLKVGST